MPRSVPLRVTGFSLGLAFAVCFPFTRAVAQEAYIAPATARLKTDVSFLADDAREGRGPATKGIDAAADYIAAIFREAGLKPAPGASGYFQEFEIRGEPKVEGTPSLQFVLTGGKRLQLEFKSQFGPMGLAATGAVQGAPVVFAGYGITAKDEQRKLDYDDYKDIDVKDKVVLVIRREPQGDKPDSPFDGKETTPYATLQHKISNAARLGAKAVLMVNDSVGLAGKPDQIEPYAPIRGIGGMPLLQISRELADQILAAGKAPSLADLEAQIDADLNPRSQNLDGVAVDLDLKIERQPIKVKNVVGVLEGDGPLAQETIVLGAHYDHLGYGDPGSMAVGSRDIHNGADDNASGTALVMELARRMGRRPEPLPRRLVFMAYSAEERGLLGSEHYVNHPLYPLDQTIAMINFDMVGRLDPQKRSVTVYGANTADRWDAIVQNLAASQGLTAAIVPGAQDVFGASDHYSFYKKNIPVLFFFTGLHADYHRPSDDSHLINYDGMTRIANLGELILLDLAQRAERPAFKKLERTPAPAVASASRGSGVYFGSRPAYAASQEGKGVVLEGVTPGSPAEKAGLKEGDRITKFGGKDVTDVESYMAAMGGFKPGDVVEIVLDREGKPLTVKATLATRPSRDNQN